MIQIKEIDQALDLLLLHQVNPHKYPFLLQSVALSATTGRYDVLFAHPQATLWLDSLGELKSDNFSLKNDSIISVFDEWFAQEKNNETADLPFYGGWFVFLAYEFAQQIEPVLALPIDKNRTLPQAYFCRIPVAIICDHQAKKQFIVCEAEYAHLLTDIEHDLREIKPLVVEDENIVFDICEDEPVRYTRAVDRIKQYIVDGDVFQVNLSRTWRAKSSRTLSPAQLFQRLRKANPAPFAGLACIGNSSIVSSSPERLVLVKNGVIETRPIAGTRPRARDVMGELDTDANIILQQELISHPKERAEHVMLIDLERNDLGRVCVPGTVKVDELMVIESYEHVHHIVSNVRGSLRPEIQPTDVIRAVFPGGTITGCPKVRCMEIIAELEQEARMAYTGSMGYINRNGDMDLNILIRTIVQNGNELTIRAGAGIVADSDPEKELQETRAKAKGMLNALCS